MRDGVDWASELAYLIELEEKMEKRNVTFTMDFGDALVALRSGAKVTRSGWNGKGMWLGLKLPGISDTGKIEPSLMTLPYIYMKTADNNLVPWLASQTDILAGDWQIFTAKD